MATFKSGKPCRFRLADVICPDRQDVLRQITAELEVEGQVVFLSDQGERKGCYAIVEVDGIASPIIIPVERLKSVPESSPGVKEDASEAQYERAKLEK